MMIKARIVLEREPEKINLPTEMEVNVYVISEQDFIDVAKRAYSAFMPSEDPKSENPYKNESPPPMNPESNRNAPVANISSSMLANKRRWKTKVGA